MMPSELDTLAKSVRCRVAGLDDAANEGHRIVLASLMRAFNCSETYVLCEPSLARKSKHPPDAVLGWSICCTRRKSKAWIGSSMQRRTRIARWRSRAVSPFPRSPAPKGYDAYCVVLASANECMADVKGRASFYVGCTRASQRLELLAYNRSELVQEMSAAIARSSGN